MDNSPFGRIAPELREMIFEYALTFDQLACIPRHPKCTEPHLSTCLALTQVCKTIRAETLHMPLTLNEPIVSDWTSNTRKDTEVIVFQVLAKAVETIASIPETLLHNRLAITIDLSCFTQWLLRSPHATFGQIDVWAYLMMSTGALVYQMGYQKAAYDFTPVSLRDENLYCASNNVTVTRLAGRASAFVVDMVLDREWVHAQTGYRGIVARLDCLRTRELIRGHATHKPDFCNVVARGETFVARLEELEHDAMSYLADHLRAIRDERWWWRTLTGW